VPDQMSWKTTDGGNSGEVKAMMLSVWDEKTQNTMRIDLWTKEMKVDEMKFFVHQSMLTMSDTFERATGEKEMTMAMKDFCDYFAEKMNLRPPS
jgi:gliding motility-associated protein GldC